MTVRRQWGEGAVPKWVLKLKSVLENCRQMRKELSCLRSQEQSFRKLVAKCMQKISRKCEGQLQNVIMSSPSLQLTSAQQTQRRARSVNNECRRREAKSVYPRILIGLKEIRELQEKEDRIRKRNERIQLERIQISKNMRFASSTLSYPASNKQSAMGTEASSREISSKKSSMEISSKSKQLWGVLCCPRGHEYYSGGIQESQPHGTGTLKYCCSQIPIICPKDLEMYEGGFVRGKFAGEGEISWSGGSSFVGAFVQGLRNGPGKICVAGDIERGVWQDDRLIY